SARTPWQINSETAVLNAAVSRPITIKLEPTFAKASAMPRPMPLAPPVMIVTWSCKSILMGWDLLRFIPFRWDAGSDDEFVDTREIFAAVPGRHGGFPYRSHAIGSGVRDTQSIGFPYGQADI